MNIILSNHYAGTGKSMEYRPYFMAKRWVRQGHQVTIVLSSFSHLRGDNPDSKGRPYWVEMIDGIRYFWIAGSEYHGNGMGRIKNMLSFIRGLSNFESAITETGRPDAVIASSTYPLEIYPLRKMADKHGAKLIYEVHDLWPLSPMELGGIPKYHPYIMLMQAAENYCYKHCDTIVSILPNAQEHMIEHGMKPEKFVCIPNGIVKEDWETTQTETPVYAEKLSQYHDEGYFLIGYTGAHGVANALDSYVEAGELLRDKKIKLLLVGQGPERERLIQKINDLELNDVVEALPAVKRDEVPGLLEQLDALYVGLQRQPLFRFGVSPNKLMDYMMAAKPVIFAIEAGNDMVADAKCGISIPPEDPAEIARAAQILASTPKAELETMGKHGQDYILKHHEYDVLSNRFLEVLAQAK